MFSTSIPGSGWCSRYRRDPAEEGGTGRAVFLYYAPGATHAPHQVSATWSDQYEGRFDDGWDAYRERVFTQQNRLGIIPADAILPDRNPAIKAWLTLPPEERKLYARFMKVYAGCLTYTDHEIGRLVDHLKQTHQFDNTLFIEIVGDNGASKEGTFNGDIDRNLRAKPLSDGDNIRYNLAKINGIGSPGAVEGNYPLGWAQAANISFRFWKSDANSEGGTRNPPIITCPKTIAHGGQLRTQYGHVIDILPTTLDVIGLKAPATIRSVPQEPIQGTSLAYTINDAAAPHPSTTSNITTSLGRMRSTRMDGRHRSPFPTAFSAPVPMDRSCSTRVTGSFTT